ncbi:protease HtpX [Striga asiatica]|uniref:Protease HtpX n=1 Tax=Striga asiatica TaxID=4170 RepID=A0A5A7NZX7_STRAF|nr:protease HtpX [Striga asiatica]
MSLVLASVGQFWKRAMGFVLGRWRINPPYFLSDIYTVLLVASSCLKHIPISNKLRLVFDPQRIGLPLKYKRSIKREVKRPHPHYPEIRQMRRLLVKLVQALSDGLRLQIDSRVTVNFVDIGRVLTGRCESVVEPRYGKKESHGCVDKLGKLWDMKCDTEHLEGLNWDLTVFESEEPNMYYVGNGKIVIHTQILNSYTEEELVAFLAHEVGHGVAMHPEGHPFLPLLALIGLIPCTSGFWCCAIFVRLCDLLLYSCRRMELEAHYIGLMLMAAAGYDPRLVPHVLQKLPHNDDDKYYLDTTHPSAGRIVEMVSQDTVMDRALKIYEQVQTGSRSIELECPAAEVEAWWEPSTVKEAFNRGVNNRQFDWGLASDVCFTRLRSAFRILLIYLNLY